MVGIMGRAVEKCQAVKRLRVVSTEEAIDADDLSCVLPGPDIAVGA